MNYKFQFINWTVRVVLALSCVVCRADGTNQFYLTTTSGCDEKIELDFAISRERLAAQPDWSPTNCDIPLQPQQAAAIALKCYRAKYPAVADSISVTSLSLQAIQLTDFHKWHYTVVFYFRDDAAKKLPNDVVSIAVVLLDGTIVEPQISPHPSNWFTSPIQITK